MRRVYCLALAAALLAAPAFGQPFKLAPAVAAEAEDFTPSGGWAVLKNGEGNYMVDIIGFCHVSGERLLSLPWDKAGSASLEVNAPENGNYRLWVRYEYPAFCDASFQVIVEQGGKRLLAHTMGTPTSERFGFGAPAPRAQHDPSWGPEGLFEEAVTVPGLKKGKARITLRGAALPNKPGVSANRNIDLVYLTRDLADRWMPHYRKRANLYPILEAFRDSRGPRWEVKITNKGKAPALPRVRHAYNRVPWGMSEPKDLPRLAPGASTAWSALEAQDTAHFSMVEFNLPGQALEVAIRPIGGKAVKTVTADGTARVYLPTYPGKGEVPTTPEEAIDRILAALKKAKAPGKAPTQPLCYGGWLPLGVKGPYGKKYARLYRELGFRSLHPAHSGPAVLENLKEVGILPNKSWAATSYRNPPTEANINAAAVAAARAGLDKHLRFFDYGDEIHFSEWLSILAAEDVARLKAAGKEITQAQAINALWMLGWLQKNRAKFQLKDYWLPHWGPYSPRGLRPDSSATAARLNPRLYVDSLLFYEEVAIGFAARGMAEVKKKFGPDVLCGANYSCHPFYYPSSTMYIKWFRGKAADMGRHSEYFWQVAQPGPMVNGYIAEHFRAGLKDVPGGVLRQYTMPHAPGNTDASFLRTAYTHLAHGATMLDFFGTGLNETFTENHIDHRAVSRFVALRDVTHCVGFVEDLLPASKAVPSEVALLVSESTERWDFAGVARDRAGHDLFGPNFRKARTHFHLERLGLWKAFTFAGCSPDLVTEEDVIGGRLGRAKLLVLVGDHWPREMVPALEEWVKKGGTVLATAASGSRDIYAAPMKQWHGLAGLKAVTTRMETTFLRPRQELPFLKPLDTVDAGAWKMPALATRERVVAEKGTEVLAKFADGTPALTRRAVGKGRVLYVAAHPGLAYLYSALVPPLVPDRGPNTHTVPTRFDAGAAALVQLALKLARVAPAIVADPPLIDARLLEAKGGYVLPLASYTGKVGEKVSLAVRVPREVKKVTSAHHGELKAKWEKGLLTVVVPSVKYGDVLRLE